MAVNPACADKAAIARETAKMLLEIGAVLFFKEEPFILTSGKASPVYTDCRKIIAYPRLRSTLMDFAAATIVRDIGYESIDTIAGGETAGIPFAAWIAERLGLPMQYVRKKAKGFGRNAQIEGNVVAGSRTLLVEDLATDGGSKALFCNALREAGARVDHCFVIFFTISFPKVGCLCKTSAFSSIICARGGTYSPWPRRAGISSRTFWQRSSDFCTRPRNGPRQTAAHHSPSRRYDRPR